MRKHDDIFKLDFAEKFERAFYCFGSDDPGGSEPDGVTFTSGEGYKPGDGIQISSDTLASNSTDDTYGGFNTSAARQAEIFGTGGYSDPFESGTGFYGGDAANQAAQVLASGGNNFTGGQAQAQAFAAPRPQARVTRTSIGDIDVDLANQAAQLLAAGANDFARQGFGTPSDFVPYTPPPGTRVVELNPSPVGQPFGKEYFDQMEAISGRRGNGLADTAAALATQDQQLADEIMASSQGVDRDSEVVSALSDNFLDERGRQDLNILAESAVDYFNNPIVEGGQFVEGLLGLPNIMTTAAGLPRFGSIGDMQIGVQQGGRLTTDDDGKPMFVTMPDGTIIGGSQGVISESDSPEPISNPMTGAVRCPDGFKLNPETNACEKIDKEEEDKAGPDFTAPSGVFFRETSLDTAPSNVPAGFDYDAANRRFIESYGLRPDFYSGPLNMTGFTKLL
jgi:hypothetical protein